MTDYPPVPYLLDDVPDHLFEVWSIVLGHEGVIDALMYGEWFCCRELTTGCRCREAPGWYPGRPAVDGCPLHKPHRCNVAALGRSWRSEGCGWRCPSCGAEWTLKRALEAAEQNHTTQYGVHPRSQCGPAFCDLLPPRPTMVWVRDEVA